MGRIIVFSAAGICAAATAPSEADAQALSLAETMRALPGQWELDPAEVPEEDRGDFRCDQSPLEILITQDETGGFRYQSSKRGDNHADRSPVLSVPSRSGRPLFMVQYEGETRLGDDGEPVSWALEMPDRDHFYWIRSDWLYGHPVPRTPMRRRCPLAVS